MRRELTAQIEIGPWVHDWYAYSPFYNLVRAAVECRRADDPRAVLSNAQPRNPCQSRRVSVFLHNDIHRFTAEKLDACRVAAAEYDFSVGPYRFSELPEWPPCLTLEDRKRMVLWPHSVPDETPPSRDDTAGGAFLVEARDAKPYPMVWDVERLNLPGLMVQKHPRNRREPWAEARKAWFPTLTKHRIGIVGTGWGGSGGYVLAKYLEYLYSGLLLMAERPQPIDCEALGLVDGENCLLFDWPAEKGRFVSTYRDAMRDFMPFAPIAEAGQRLAVDRHGVGRRLEYLEEVLDYFTEYGDVPPVDWQIDALTRGGVSCAS